MKEKIYQNLSIRVDAKLLDQVKRIAQKEQRTVSGQVRYWIRRAVWNETTAQGIANGIDAYFEE